MFNKGRPVLTLKKIVKRRKVTKGVRKTAPNSLSGILKAEEVEDLLKALLDYMEFILSVDSSYRRNIEGFKGTYFFKTKNRNATVLAKFHEGQMQTMKDVSEEDSNKADVTVTFKDSQAMLNFVFGPIIRMLKDLFDPQSLGVDFAHKFDILESLRRNEVTVAGNLNYLYKFAFMANHLLLDAERFLGL